MALRRRRWTGERSRLGWLALLAVVASGCVFTARPRWQATWNDPWHQGWLDPGVVPAPAPPVAAQLEPTPVGVGGAGQTWVSGHYERIDQRYEWIAGHWANPPQPGWQWQQPSWHRGQWYRGYWHAPNDPVASVYAAGQGQWNADWQQPHALPVAQPVNLSSGAVVVRPTTGSTAVIGAGSAIAAVATPVRLRAHKLGAVMLTTVKPAATDGARW